MTPQEKAKAGLWLLKQAVLDYLATQPDCAARPDDVRAALQLLDEDPKGGHKGYLLWGLSNLLKAEGKVRKEDMNGFNHMVLVQ